MEIQDLNFFFIAFITLLYTLMEGRWIWGWFQLPKSMPVVKKGHTKVSVLVAARNEEAFIEALIKDLLAQDYPKELTEIVIINDHSTDRTEEIVLLYRQEGIKLITLQEGDVLNSYKKKAIERGIATSEGTLIVTTDSDCRMGTKWLSTLVAYYEQTGDAMISAPVLYFEGTNLFERFQALEFVYLIGMGASAIGLKETGACNGANLAYEKQAFYEVDGFKGIDHIASGDDELLLHKMRAAGKKIGFLKNTAAVVYTYAKPDLRSLLEQRKRWASKSTKYQDKRMVLMGLFIWFFNLSIVLNFAIALWQQNTLLMQWVLCQFLWKIWMDISFLFVLTSFFKRKHWLVLLPLLNVIHLFYMIYIGLVGNSGKYQWKGRKVN